MPDPSNPRDVSRAQPRAILFTDIVGSTSYFARRGDEAGLRMLAQHNRALFPVVEEANGRIVKTIGDSILAVFDQPVDALRAAWGLQQQVALLRSTLAAEEEGIHIRVGVHYGLVTGKDNDVFGDAVNLAERVKSKAGGDEVFVSRTLRDMVRARPAFVFQSAGSHELKGASEPMELFRLTGAPAPAPASRWRKWARRGARAARRRRSVMAVVALLLLAAGASWWWLRPTRFPASDVAVLPFQNVMHDSNVSLALSLPAVLENNLEDNQSLHFHRVPVEQYMNQAWDPQQVAQKLKVGTIVEGSFWPDGNDIRVKVDLIDARENRERWSRLFNGSAANLLTLVGQMVPQVAQALNQLIPDALAGGISRAGADRATSSHSAAGFPLGTENPQAYELYLRGLDLQRRITEGNIRLAQGFLEQAVALDPHFAEADALLAQVDVTPFWWNFNADTSSLNRAEDLAERAVAIEPNSAEAHYALAYVSEAKGHRAEAIRQSLLSIQANPHYLPALTNVARYFFYMGDFDHALGTLDRIATFDPMQNIHVRKAIYLYFAGRLAQSAAENREAEKLTLGGVDELIFIATTYVWLDDLHSAERVMHRLEQVQKGNRRSPELHAWLDTARGQISDARKEMVQLEPLGSTHWGVAQELASLYARQGDRKQALYWLEKANQIGAMSYVWFISKDFQILRGDPRYEAVLKSLSDEYKLLRPELERVYTNIQR